ncbi:hypothetical protein [Cohnella abietis]|uniref:Rho termination factor N-terminal domain-containing protein n=1 Tax=Cohnella abietis TaxID=2507935 RepID=A0A3T1D1P5_9BACL|nr:hypothetical protein [Cohnella abietis]BBI32037.1 hypothetical protein KCTCHS21_14360 [Cohnella abietis]
MAKVIAPNNQYNGVSAGVTFIHGSGETSDPSLLDWFREHGYEVEEVQEEIKQPATDKPLDKQTLPELKDYAALHEIDIGEASKKEDILSVIQLEISKREAAKQGAEGGGAGGNQQSGDPDAS